MIKVQNIYYMLSYAFNILNENGYKKLSSEKFENDADLLAEILILGVKNLIKRGIGKDYILMSELTSLPKGKINFNESIKINSYVNHKLVCEFDEFSINSYMNRIIKTTFTKLLLADIDKKRKKEIKKILFYFSEVEEIDVYQINWKLNYNRNNQIYHMLINVCNLVLKGMIQSDKQGNLKLQTYIDNQQTYKLYEKFIFEYYKKEYKDKIKVSAPQIKWLLDDGEESLLPIMQTDITMQKDDRMLIIDAKYYNHSLQTKFEKRTFISGHIYQIFTYVKNQDKKHNGKVSGLLLYAKTEEENIGYHVHKMDGNKIVITSLDLNNDFIHITSKLNYIADEFIDGEI